LGVHNNTPTLKNSHAKSIFTTKHQYINNKTNKKNGYLQQYSGQQLLQKEKNSNTKKIQGQK
jgi:hypothetical protein